MRVLTSSCSFLLVRGLWARCRLSLTNRAVRSGVAACSRLRHPTSRLARSAARLACSRSLRGSLGVSVELDEATPFRGRLVGRGVAASPRGVACRVASSVGAGMRQGTAVPRAAFRDEASHGCSQSLPCRAASPRLRHPTSRLARSAARLACRVASAGVGIGRGAAVPRAACLARSAARLACRVASAGGNETRHCRSEGGFSGRGEARLFSESTLLYRAASTIEFISF